MRESNIHANCVGGAVFASITKEDKYANFVQGFHFVHMIVKSINVYSVKDLPSVCMGELNTNANRVEAQDYASISEKRPFVGYVEVKLCVSMEKSGKYVGYVKEVLSVLKNVQIMANKKIVVQDVEVASSARIVFLLLSVGDVSSVHLAYQFPSEVQEMRRPSLLLS